MIDSARHIRVSAGLQDSPNSHPETESFRDPALGETNPEETAGDPGVLVTLSTPEAATAPEGDAPAASSEPGSPEATDGMDDYARLRRRLILATLILSAVAVGFTELRFGAATAGSLLVGALAGVLYLRLLARSVEKLGNGSKSVSKVQLLVPVVLVLAAARLPQLQMLPALIGFLLYKPAILLQASLDR